ncbi:hypothetical protein PT974_11696 [Cladobotryum mycophilum]|uniref:LCCL domain-containing protein n=1 Tax=Cladobotryum mycophilum TaxID=491253 RepID=A0ABR0S5W5_9HYPO
MAAPAERTIKDLSGHWTLNKTISDDSDPVLTLQGVGFLMRKAIGIATIQLEIKQYEDDSAVTHIDIKQTALKLNSEEARTVDDTVRPVKDNIFGDVESKSLWVSLEDAAVDDEYLKEGWLAEGDGKFVMTVATHPKNGWTAKQIWGFKEVDGVRRYSRSVVVTKGSESKKIHMHYDYNGPLAPSS